VLGLRGSEKRCDGTGHGESNGSVVLYGEVNVGEALGDVCMLAGSVVSGRKDRGDEEGFWEDDDDSV
jgi:hypothetical protein